MKSRLVSCLAAGLLLLASCVEPAGLIRGGVDRLGEPGDLRVGL